MPSLVASAALELVLLQGGEGPEWLQGALPHLVGKVAQAVRSTVPYGLAIRDLSFIMASAPLRRTAGKSPFWQLANLGEGCWVSLPGC